MSEPPGPTDPQSADPTTPIVEIDWLARISTGDQQAFRAVVDRHLVSIVGIARRMLRDDAEAEDVAQEVLLRLWRNASNLELGAGGLKPWLRRVTTNLCIDRVRSGRRLTVVDDLPEVAEPATQQLSLEESDLSQRVTRALQSLPDRQRAALVLFHYEGLSLAEVGETLGVSGEAVESLLARARRQLKALLSKEWRELLPDEEQQP